jgi:pectate lyase
MKSTCIRNGLTAWALAWLAASSHAAQDVALNVAPADGWAAQAGGTVGGAAAAANRIYTVGNRAQLLAAFSDGGLAPKIVKVMGTIDMTEGQPFTSHADQVVRAAIKVPANTTWSARKLAPASSTAMCRSAAFRRSSCAI